MKAYTTTLALLVGLNSIVSVFAETLTLTNRHGKVLHQIEITRKLPDALIYRSPAGGGRIMVLDLTEAQQVQFGYDPATIAKATEDAKKQKAEAERSYNEFAARSRAAAAARTAENARFGPIRHRLSQQSRMIVGTISQVIPEGFLIFSGAAEYDKFAEAEIAGGRTPDLANYPNDTRAPGAVFVGHCLIQSPPKKDSYADGNSVKMTGFPSGTYTYTTTEKSVRTVKRFFPDLESAVASEAKKLH